jgi:glycosyltransferase involved in cell wall biosynthesis
VLKSNLYGALTAKMANVPVVIATEMTLKDIASSSLNRFRDKLIQPLVAMVIDNCDKFIVTSQYIKNEWLNAKNSHRIEVIYPPFNLEKYDEAVRNPRRMTESVGKRVGFVGRLSEEKSVKILIDAMSIVIKQIPDADLTIVGTGPQEKFLREYCTQLNIDKSVFFTGYRENSFHELKEMDLFVLPSRTEGCPIVILEAMAMGLPVVATRVGGNMELVEDFTTGLLVPHGDAEKMAEAILQLICDKENARNMGQNGRKRAFSQFHPSSFTSTIQMLYRQLFDQKKLV